MIAITQTYLTLVALMVPGQVPDKATPPQPRFTISKETTYITKPLTKQGFPNYAAAINQRFSRGVTAENNANVLFWRAMGPHPEKATMDPEFFRLMGMGEPPEDDQHFVGLDDYLKDFEKIDPNSDKFTKIVDQQRRAYQEPWKIKDFPAIAAWLAVNEVPLGVAIEGSQRPRYYSPLYVPEEAVPGGLIAVLLPAIQKSRAFGRALSARAMLHLGEGRVDAAWQDLLACHRIGRLVGRGPTLIEGLVGIAIDSIANSARLTLIQHAPPTAEQAAKYLRDLDALPPLPNMGEKTYICERFFFLDMTFAVAKRGIARAIADFLGVADLPAHLEKIPFESVDWDIVLRMGNEWFDRIEDAIKTKDRAARATKLDAITKTLKELARKFGDLQANLKKIAELIKNPNDADKTLSQMIGTVLIKLLTPGWNAVMKAEGRAIVRHASSRAAIVLAAYHQDNGHYPKQLSELRPKYMKQLPNDHYSGKPLIFKPTDDGYLLYSVGRVGPNGKDENGQRANETPKGDDIILRMPYEAE